ncbi:uncharacterized [Tachysurus ichikawai]
MDKDPRVRSKSKGCMQSQQPPPSLTYPLALSPPPSLTPSHLHPLASPLTTPGAVTNEPVCLRFLPSPSIHPSYSCLFFFFPVASDGSAVPADTVRLTGNDKTTRGHSSLVSTSSSQHHVKLIGFL